MTDKKQRQEFLKLVRNVSSSAMDYQSACEHQPANYGGKNKTAIDRAAAQYRGSVRKLCKMLSIKAPSMDELHWMIDYYAKLAPWEVDQEPENFS